MESFEDQFTNHAVHNIIEQLATSVADVSDDDVNTDAANYVARIDQGVAVIRNRLDVASPVLTTAAKLNQIQQPIQACLNEVNQYKANKNIGHLANASNHLDGALAQAASTISLEQPDTVVTAQDAVSFKKLADAVIASLTAKAADSETKIAGVTQKCDELAGNIEAQNSRITTLNGEIETKVNALQATFDKSQAEKKNAFEAVLEDVREVHQTKLEELSKSGSDVLTSMSEQQQMAEHIVHLIGNIGVTGNFRGAATREAKLANVFRVIALLCFLGMVAVILYMGFLSLHEKFDLWLAIFRFATGFAFLVPGVYAARESSWHRTLEHKNRRAELELASIDSYLNSLPKEKQDEIKAELSPRYFGGADGESEDQNGVTGKSLVDLLAAAIKGLSSK